MQINTVGTTVGATAIWSYFMRTLTSVVGTVVQLVSGGRTPVAAGTSIVIETTGNDYGLFQIGIGAGALTNSQLLMSDGTNTTLITNIPAGTTGTGFAMNDFFIQIVIQNNDVVNAAWWMFCGHRVF